MQVLLSEKPEYNVKIKAGFLLAPAVIMTNAYNPIFLFADLAGTLENILHWLGFYEFLPHPGELLKIRFTKLLLKQQFISVTNLINA